MFKLQFQTIYSPYFALMLWTNGKVLGASAIHHPPSPPPPFPLLTSCPLLKLTQTFPEELVL